jgi:hypothetical protein
MKSHPERNVERQFKDAAIRVRRHWYEDGLVELFVGALFAVLALYFLAQALLAGRLSANRPWSIAVNLLLPAVVVGAGLLARRSIRRAKERHVYPRTGFVRYRDTRRAPRWVTATLAAAVAALTASLVARAPGVDAWVPALQGFLLGGFFFWQGRSAGVSRLVVLALLTALVGLAVSLAGLSPDLSGAAFFGLVGLAMMAAGQAAFRRHLRDAPPPEES